MPCLFLANYQLYDLSVEADQVAVRHFKILSHTSGTLVTVRNNKCKNYLTLKQMI